MNVGIVKKIKNLIVLLFIVLVFGENVFAEGPGVAKQQKIAVVGDSYAGHFSVNEGIDGFEYYIFPVGTITNTLNDAVFETAINGDSTYILFATGVNDQALNTDIKEFESILRKYIEEIVSKNKFLFFHTYMEYANMKNGHGSFFPADYDKVYKRLADEFENVMYIDMSAFNSIRYDFGDGVHYNKLFYDSLNAKLQFYIYSIERSVFKTIGTEISNEQRKHIAVAGDIGAYDFFGYENKRDYLITNYSSPGKIISECKENISQAFDSDALSVFLTVGIDDYEEQTDINNFKDELRQCLNEASTKHKNVFLYTSFDYRQEKWLTITISDYDMAVEQVANEYPSVCFINLRNFTKEVPQIYDMLYKLLDNMIKEIR